MRKDRAGHSRSPRVQVAQVKALACQPPEASGVPLARWSCPELATQVLADQIVASVSASDATPVV